MIALGIAGLVLPVLQGVLFLIAGLLLLSREYEWAQRLLAALSRRFPKVRHAADSAYANSKAWLRKVRYPRRAN